MEAPKCKLCGEPHWGQCPKYAAPLANLRRLSPKERAIVREVLAEQHPQQEPIVQKAIDVLDAASKPKFDRNAYQREYMRAYRARKKEAK